MTKKITSKERWQLLSKFTDWLFDHNDVELPQEVLKVLNHRILISALFKSNPILLKHLNAYLNNKNVYSVSIQDLAKYIKKLVKLYGLTRKDIWWFSNLELQVKLQRLPLLKQFEKDMILKWYKEDKLHDKEIVTIHYKPKPKKMKIDMLHDKSSNEVSMINKTTNISLNTLHELREYYGNIKNIKESCKSCGLYNRPIVTFDSNVQNVKNNIDVLFVAEAPGETEVEEGYPLVGKAGKLFRSFMNQYFSNYKWLITNTCLCRPAENRKPTKDEMICCASNLDDIIRITNPRLIIALGSTPVERLTGKSLPVTKHRGEIHKYRLNDKEYDVFITVHPSYIVRNPNNSYIYEEDFIKASQELQRRLNTISLSDSALTYKHVGLSKVTKDIRDYYIHLDEKYYHDYDLVDMQQVNVNTIAYIFRHKQTKQLEIVKLNIDEYNYRFYLKGRGRHILTKGEIEKAIQEGKLFIAFGNQHNDDKGLTPYESDIYPDVRHSIDYYYVIENIHNKQNDYIPRVVYFDIEVNAPVFPKPELAKYPVTLITAKFVVDNKEYNKVYALSNKISRDKSNTDKYLDIIDKYDIQYFRSEENLITTFLNDLQKYDVDILAAWNISFDIGYLYNRLHRLLSEKTDDNTSIQRQINKLFSRVDNATPVINLERHYLDLPGYIIVDLMTGYKFITYGNRESYSLDYITQYEGISKEGKKFKGAKFNELWESNRVYALAYNIEDVELIYKLDKKLAIIDFINEYRKVAKVSWKHYTSTSKTSDSLIMYFAKTKGYLVRNKLPGQSGTGTKVGAYVYPVIPGIHWYMYEADFASLYPSIIQTFNISPNTLVAEFKNGLEDVIRYIAKDDTKPYEVTLNPIYDPIQTTFTYKELDKWIKANNYLLAFGGGIFKSHDEELSILADIIAYLKTRRKYYKKLFKETGEKKYDLFQLAYKIALNALYGFLGFEGSRFMHVSLVNNVTLSGQIINKLSALTFHHSFMHVLNEVKKELGLQ